MNSKKVHLVLLGSLFVLNSVFAQKQVKSAQFEFDHLVIFTQSKQLEKNLENALFTLAEKAGSQHNEQGTEGHYFFFYNTFIELLYAKDSVKILANESKFGSAYGNRWKKPNDNCPFGFGLNLTPFDTNLTNYKFKVYASSDAPVGEYYLMSENNKTNQQQPMIYLSMPHHAYKPYSTINDVDQRFEEHIRADQKSYLTHPSGVKRLTEIILTIPEETGSDGNIEILKTLNQVKVQKGNKYGLTLTFDNQAQEKEVVVPNDFQLIIKY